MRGNNILNRINKYLLNEDEMQASKYCFNDGKYTPEKFEREYKIKYSDYPQYFKIKNGKINITDAYIKRCNLDLFEDVELETVKLNRKGEEIEGYIRTRDTKFAYVHIKGEPWIKLQYEWEVFNNAVKNGTVLDI